MQVISVKETRRKKTDIRLHLKVHIKKTQITLISLCQNTNLMPINIKGHLGVNEAASDLLLQWYNHIVQGKETNITG